MKGLLTIS